MSFLLANFILLLLINIYFQKIGDLNFQDNFLVPEGETNQLSTWDIKSGAWFLHTAADNAVARGNIKPKSTRKPEPTRSPNFYSLQGQGTNAVIATGCYFDDSYTVESAVDAVPGEMGLVFYLQEHGGYYAFTSKMEENSYNMLLSLWRVASTNNMRREVLESVATQLTPGQWVKLKVKTFQNRIQCYMDNIKLLDIPAVLPVGGQFGLYANSNTGVRFDDVRAKSNHDLDFKDVSAIRRYTIVENGNFLPGRRFFYLFPPIDT